MAITITAVPLSDHSPAAPDVSIEERSLSRLLILLIALPTLAVPCAAVFAGDWTRTARLSVRETYTDNLRLSPQGPDRTHDWVTDMNAGVLARGRGGRVDGSFFYNLQGVVRAKDETTDVNHQLQAKGTAELIERRFFLDAGGTVAQTNVTNTGVRALDNINVTGNRIDTITYRVSPHVRERFGSFANASARYTFDEVINVGDAADSRSNRVNLDLQSGSRFNRVRWSASYSRQHIENRDAGGADNRSENDFERVNATIRYLFSRQFSVFASAGWDANDFASLKENEGSSWRVGGTWTPSRRTSAEVSYGERYFGKFVAFSVNHRRRRTVFSASLDQDQSTVRELQLQRILIPLFDPFGNPIVDPISGLQFAIPLDIPTLTDEVFIRRRLQGSIALQGVRTTATLRGFQERREFQLSGEDETVHGVSGNITRSLSPHTSFRVSGIWQATDFRDGIREDTQWQVRARLTRRLGRSVNASLAYSRTERDSNVIGNEFEENRAVASLSMSF